MTNIFQRIGNKLERDKEEKKKIKEKYWKLSPIERIDYDQKLEGIKKEKTSLINFKLTLNIIIFFLGLIFILFLVYFGVGVSPEITLMRNISKGIFRYIVMIFVLEFIFNTISSFTYNGDKKIKELNKRFKLC